jgi:hypothetical protein
VRRLLADHQAQEVKTIGDALMLRTGDAAAAIRLGLCIIHDVGARHGFPLVRVGMHTGPAVERGGDWFRDYALPVATLQLRQGFGRLVRGHADRGDATRDVRVGLVPDQTVVRVGLVKVVQHRGPLKPGEFLVRRQAVRVLPCRHLVGHPLFLCSLRLSLSQARLELHGFFRRP